MDFFLCLAGILLLLFTLSHLTLNDWLVSNPSITKKEPSSGRDWSFKWMNKLFLLVLLVVAGTSITFGLIGTSITFDDIETKSETKMSLRGSDFAQKFEYVSQVNDQEPLTLMQALISDDT